MNCTFSKELLALHAENDLPDSDERVVANHLRDCGSCQLFLGQLRERQSQLKSLRQQTIDPAVLASMRQDVMSRVENSTRGFDWTVRLERMLLLGFRRHVTVFAGVAVAVIVSATLLAQIRNVGTKPESIVNLTGGETLVLPEGYREWVSVGSSLASGDIENPHIPAKRNAGLVRNIYINPSAYLEFRNTGKFPDGAVLMMETSSAASKQTLALEVSVKDKRFGGGWGFFDFTDSDGRIKDKSQAIADNSSCRGCHEERAKTDHVFTQFHPALKTAT